jgi:hypothetical protein
VAQSRAATWHPVIGSLVTYKSCMGCTGVEPATSRPGNGLAGLG